MNIEWIMNRVKNMMEGDCSGHDYWHIFRVYKNAMKIAESEDCDKSLVAMAALLHDVDDKKLFATENYENAQKIMKEAGLSSEDQNSIINIIKEVSFKGCESITPTTIEGMIVQDADRLDAMGAIGIARTFAFGGNRNRCIYDPDMKPKMDLDGEKYLNNEGSSVNHFYEKLFKLKDMMNTHMAKEMAERRDKFMHEYLEEFFKELDEI